LLAGLVTLWRGAHAGVVHEEMQPMEGPTLEKLMKYYIPWEDPTLEQGKSVRRRGRRDNVL